MLNSTETIGETSSKFVASKINQNKISIDQEFQLTWGIGKKAIRTKGEDLVLKLRSLDDDNLENPDRISYSVSDPDDNRVLRIDRDGLINADYTLCDIETNEPIAVFDKKTIATSDRAWQIKDPTTEEITHRLNTTTRFREAFHNAPSSVYYPSIKYTVTKEANDEIVCRERRSPEIWIFLPFGGTRTVKVQKDTNGVDVILSLLLLSLEKE